MGAAREAWSRADAAVVLERVLSWSNGSALALLVLAAPLAAQDGGYQIRPGDRISTRLFTAAGSEVDVVTGERTVDREGNLFLPFLGPVRVTGLDEPGLRTLLTERYASFYSDPVVDLVVELRVNITGSVGRPGQYFVNPTATISDALAQAGGMTSELAVNSIQIPSDPRAVRLVRDGATQILNLRPDEVSDEVLAMRVRSGDWIHVPARGRSRIRDEITFWGSVVSLVGSIIVIGVLIS